MVALSDYAGREQSYVKHVFLERYLERLVHKVASVYRHIVYVDGFAGPWQSANEKFDDTSFGIALHALRRAKASWKERGRDVRMSAFLVEREAAPYGKLEQIPAKYPDVAIKTYPAGFLTVLPDIIRVYRRRAPRQSQEPVGEVERNADMRVVVYPWRDLKWLTRAKSKSIWK